MHEYVVTLAWHAAYLLAFLASLAVTWLLIAWLVGGAWWPSVLFQLSQRPTIARRLLVRSMLVAVVPSTLAGGAAGLAAGMLLWLVLVPRFIAHRANAAAWRADDAIAGRRAAALAVRNRQRERVGEEAFTGTAPWATYIIDVAKSERQRRYQEQFDRDNLIDTPPNDLV